MRILAAAAVATRHAVVAVAEALLVAAILAALLLALAPVYQPADFLAGARSADAARGGNANRAAKTGDGGSIAVAMVYDRNGDGGPNWNDTITFDVSTTATDKPWVRLDCYQAGNWVYTASAGFFPTYLWAPNFTLASTAWAGGAADCTATLYMVTSNGRSKTLATLDLAVAP